MRALLGTFVSVRVHGRALERAHVAIEAAFVEVAAVHALMSFHEEDSDVSRLNREGRWRSVSVDPRTYEVLSRATAIASMCDGVFDVTIAPTLVARGLLPLPACAMEPDGAARWHDVELLPDNRVRFRRPLWIDLGGIAKGYAVDRAIEAALAYTPAQVCVNAGGDLRIAGPQTERIRLAAEMSDPDTIPLMELSNGSLASSCGYMSGRERHESIAGAHVDTLRSHGRRPRQFVSVAAPRCIDADALTKVVMARGACGTHILAAFAAKAVVHDAQFGWRQIQGHT